MLASVAIAVLTMTLVTTKKLMNGLIDSTLVVMTLIAFYGVYDWFPNLPGSHITGFYDTDISSLYRIGSVYMAAPTLAYVLSIFIPLGIYRIFTATRIWSRLLAMIATLVMVLGFALTFARIPFAGFAVSLFVMAIFLPYRRLRIGMISAMLILGGGSVLIAQILGVPLLSRFANNDLSSLNGRTLLWTAIIENFDPHRILGAGLQGSDQLLIQLQVGHGTGVVGTAPHNIFLAALYDQGIIGLILVIMLHIALLYNLLRRLRGASPTRHLLIAACLAAYTNILFQSIEVTVFWSQSVAPYLWMLMSLPFASYWDTEHTSPENNQEVEGSEQGTSPRLEAIQQKIQKEQLTYV
jgi:O-antigen ligase